MRRARAATIRARTPAAGDRGRPPRYDTTTSSRPRILRVARMMAAELGYENLKLSDITAAAEISHQGFYIYFKNKRHAVAVATSDQLGAVAGLVISSSRADEAWAKRLEDEIDNALAEVYPSPDGPESRLRRKLVEVIAANAFNRTRIEELVKASTLGHGEFYRRYGGKKGSLQRIYGQALAELEDEVSAEGTLRALAQALAADPERATLLAIGSSYLPYGVEQELGVATQRSFAAFVGGLAAETNRLRPAEAVPFSGAVLELIRSAVMDGRTGDLVSDLETISYLQPATPERPVQHLIAA